MTIVHELLAGKVDYYLDKLRLLSGITWAVISLARFVILFVSAALLAIVLRLGAVTCPLPCAYPMSAGDRAFAKS